jgi:hypothetical protein
MKCPGFTDHLSLKQVRSEFDNCFLYVISSYQRYYTHIRQTCAFTVVLAGRVRRENTPFLSHISDSSKTNMSARTRTAADSYVIIGTESRITFVWKQNQLQSAEKRTLIYFYRYFPYDIVYLTDNDIH